MFYGWEERTASIKTTNAGQLTGIGHDTVWYHANRWADEKKDEMGFWSFYISKVWAAKKIMTVCSRNRCRLLRGQDKQNKDEILHQT